MQNAWQLARKNVLEFKRSKYMQTYRTGLVIVMTVILLTRQHLRSRSLVTAMNRMMVEVTAMMNAH